jgi:hypothetical protein
MKRIKTLLATALLAATGLANAGVVYTWQTTATSSSIYSATGFIELSDAAVASGVVNYAARGCADYPCDLSDPGSPILRFGFNVNYGVHSALDINPVTGEGYHFESPTFDVALRIVGNTLVIDQLDVNTMFATLWLSGTRINRFSSDTDICLTGCDGAEGRFVANQVPEPATLALFGLGIGGAVLARRRRRPVIPASAK